MRCCCVCLEANDLENLPTCSNEAKHVQHEDCLINYIMQLNQRVFRNPDGLIPCPDQCQGHIPVQSLKICEAINDRLRGLISSLLQAKRHTEEEKETKHVLQLARKFRLQELSNPLCPGCYHPFVFDGCLAVTCEDCDLMFCGACEYISPSLDDAHFHTQKIHGDVFFPREEIVSFFSSKTTLRVLYQMSLYQANSENISTLFVRRSCKL